MYVKRDSNDHTAIVQIIGAQVPRGVVGRWGKSCVRSQFHYSLVWTVKFSECVPVKNLASRLLSDRAHLLKWYEEIDK